MSGASIAAPRLALFGGTFDPVHAAHLRCARLALAHGDVDRVLFVPAARSPHKPGGPDAGDADRLALLAVALEGDPALGVWTVELERGGPSYTLDTLEAARAAREPLGLPEPAWLLGEDQLAGLPRWREPDRCLALARPLVVPRAPGSTADAALGPLAGALAGATLARLRAGWLDVEPVELSATALRAALARGEDPGDRLPPGVLGAIRERGLYGSAGP